MAEQNYYDAVDHLYYNQIHASALFADRMLRSFLYFHLVSHDDGSLRALWHRQLLLWEF